MTGLGPGARRPSVAPGPRPIHIPELGDALRTRAADVNAVAGDFGNRVRRVPAAVLRPRSAQDIAAVARFGAQHKIPVVPRGAGHTVDGQAQTGRGIVVDMTALDGVGPPVGDRIAVEAGARWSAVVDTTLSVGLVPPVLPDYLQLTVGGTLVAGGVGGASHRHGSIADNVIELHVVTPHGGLVICSPHRNRELFDAVRGTQGEHGIVIRATLALTRAETSVRRYLLSYAGLPSFLADQRRLAVDGRFGHVLGQAVFDPSDGFQFVLEAAATFSGKVPDDGALLDGLRHERGTEQISTIGLRDFLGRLGPLETRLRASGSWHTDPHPRCNVMLPGRTVEETVSGVLAGLTPKMLGAGGSVLFIPIPTKRLTAPNMPKADDPLTVLFGVQRTAPAGASELVARMRQANAQLYATARAAGGAAYTHLTEYHTSREGDPSSE